MKDLFFLLFSFFFNNFFFLFSLIYFVFFFSFSWGGSFIVLDGVSSLSLTFISILSYYFIYLTESSFIILRTVSFLVLNSVYFFISGSFISMYILLEITLFPLLFLLLGFGRQVEKISSSYYLIFYTVICSLPFIFTFFINFYIFSSVPFLSYGLTSPLLLLYISLIFLVKLPFYIIHLWLPKVHVESPTSSRIILASLLLKIGTYGITRLLGGYFINFCFFLFFFSLVGIFLLSFLCCSLRDTKILVAYSSIIHINFFLLVIFSYRRVSKLRGLILIISHGLISIGLFYIVGECYFYFSTRIIYLTHSF